eukprot:TRINITY_DN100445_c0_g1_i1.p1 TRINITY_DN100445_c0_g1~~TRINITY_DN100445_c0_g1_i1.p1  ORF type:complete len:946 (-),score=188.93 TRINITY_DN100445_c0_g1_i1:441-3239(-)
MAPIDAAGQAGYPNSEPTTAEQWKKEGNEAYREKRWRAATECYTAALRLCDAGSDLGLACLNNRAACWSQLGDHSSVVEDASAVIQLQPANVKALVRRMVAFEASGRKDEALADAAAILTIEPANARAKQLVDRLRRGHAVKAVPTGHLPRKEVLPMLHVFLFTENRPLRCYASLRALRRHAKDAQLSVTVFWSASSAKLVESYQLLQGWPELCRADEGTVNWLHAPGGELFKLFSRTVNRQMANGSQHMLLLSDRMVFYRDFSVGAAIEVLTMRSEVFTVRLDLNPRIEFFPEAKLLAWPPLLQTFAKDAGILLWTRHYEKSKAAFEAVSREVGWNAILPWTATIIRTEHVQHFFSALSPAPQSFEEMDSRAADWLSRRQRMKASEVQHRSACFAQPLLVSVVLDALDDAHREDALLRCHLRQEASADVARFAVAAGWSLEEAEQYLASATALDGDDAELVSYLLAPCSFGDDYLASGVVARPSCLYQLPRQLQPPQPLVSWLVPVRNMKHFLPDCITSIERQQGIGAGCFEVVFVDDSSDDETLEYLRTLKQAKPYIRIVGNDAQCGIARSLMTGWEHCQGDFVVRLDADDEADEERLRTQLRFFAKHEGVAVLGGHTQAFWTEERKFVVDRCAVSSPGSMKLAVWREFHGTQTSRRREELTLLQRGSAVWVDAGCAELNACKVTRIGEHSLLHGAEGWQDLLQAAQQAGEHVLLQRRDPLESRSESLPMHPLLVRASLLFEESAVGTTIALRRSAFRSCPFNEEEAECHAAWLRLEPHQHIANVGDVVVRKRRHSSNRAGRDASNIYESQCAAIRDHLREVVGLSCSLQDAEGLLHFRGPRSSEQGEKIAETLAEVRRYFVREYVRPPEQKRVGSFWTEFVDGKEDALEAAVDALHERFAAVVASRQRVISQAEADISPRPTYSRELPR